jgi:DNA invertase Pin-like site-specific DNA recombinase
MPATRTTATAQSHGTQRSLRSLETVKAYSYVRFSTPEQSKGDSLRRQTQAAEDYAARHGLELVDASYQDLGVSAYRGTNAHSGKLSEFREAVRDGTIAPGSYLLIESMDRLSRQEPRTATRLLEDICTEGVTVVTLNDNRVYNLETFSSDPMAFILAYMVSIRSHEESKTKSLRIAASWNNKRAKASDKPLTALAPGWLTLDKTTASFLPIPERVEVVQKVFKMALSGLGQHRIAETLNRENIPCFGGGKFFYKSYISKLLENPAVIGTFIPHRIETTSVGKKVRHPLEPVSGYFPPIISEDDFRAVSAMRLSRRAPTVKGSGTLQNILGGLAVCPCCGSAMTRVTKGTSKKAGRAKLICTNAKVGGGCEYRSVDLQTVEEAVIDGAERLIAELPVGNDDLANQINAASEELDNLRDEGRELVSALVDAPSPSIRRRLNEIDEAISAAEGELKALVEQGEASNPRMLKARLAELKDILEATPLDRDRANALMRVIWQKVTVNYLTGYLELTWKSNAVTHLSFDPTIIFKDSKHG